jgi:hypothetical protein
MLTNAGKRSQINQQPLLPPSPHDINIDLALILPAIASLLEYFCKIPRDSHSHGLFTMQSHVFRNYTFYGETVPALVICPELCQRIFEECGQAQSGSDVLSQKYTQSDDFCMAFVGALVAGSGECFNSASSHVPWLSFALVFVALFKIH